MRVVLNVSRCIGAAACAMAAEDVFTLNEEEGTVELLRQPDAEAQERTREAARACPTGAIVIVED